jgi:hypothetical protein
MNFYEQLHTEGQLWIRSPKGEKQPANIALSSIFLKYETVNPSFYHDLDNNNIERFDILQDTLFIETSSGFILEKFYIDNFIIKPYSNVNSFEQFLDTKIDYWYNETTNNIYYINVQKVQPTTQQFFTFLLNINKFNIETGRLKFKNTHKIQIGIDYQNSEWLENQYVLESPKITYNQDTQIYNVSFIVRNYNNKMGLISINFEEKEKFKITEINGFLPYFTTTPLSFYTEII